jgi:hypothetical protein
MSALSRRRLWTLIRYYAKMGLPDSTAMVLLKIALHSRPGQPVSLGQLHLGGDEQTFEAEINYLKTIGLIRRYKTDAGYVYSLRPLWRMLDSISVSNQLIVHISSPAKNQKLVGDASTARIFMDKILALLDEWGETEPGRRQEIDDWQCLGDAALDYLMDQI